MHKSLHLSTTWELCKSTKWHCHLEAMHSLTDSGWVWPNYLSIWQHYGIWPCLVIIVNTSLSQFSLSTHCASPCCKQPVCFSNTSKYYYCMLWEKAKKDVDSGISSKVHHDSPMDHQSTLTKWIERCESCPSHYEPFGMTKQNTKETVTWNAVMVSTILSKSFLSQTIILKYCEFDQADKFPSHLDMQPWVIRKMASQKCHQRIRGFYQPLTRLRAISR